MKKNLLVIGLIMIAGLSYPALTKAQTAQPNTNVSDSITLTAIPPRLGDDNDLSAAPGEKIQTTIKVLNNSDKAFTINTSVDDFIINEDGETPVAMTEDVIYRWSLKNWLILTPEFQVLQPKQTGIINVIIDIPSDALPGGHYAMVTHKPVELNGEKFQDESASKISQRVGTLMYVVVEGPINEEAFVRDFSMPDFTEYGPVPFSFIVDNQSDIHIKPDISIEIYNLFGIKVDTIVIGSKNVFPMVGRDFNGEWDQVWGTGYYRAKLMMAYGSEGAVTIAHTSFWLLPITILIAVLVIILTLIVIFVATKRHLLHRNNAEKQRMEMLEEKISQLEAERLEKFDN